MSDADDLKKMRKSRAVEQQLRQFLKLETGLGNSPEFKRGYAFAYEFTVEQKRAVNELMESGLDFETAFDQVASRE